MSKYIEFIGAPAVGKTTTYEVLKNQHKLNDVWFPANKLETIVNFKKRLKYLIEKIINRKIFSGYQKINGEVLNRFVESNPELMEFLWQTFPLRQRLTNGKDFRIHGLLILLKRFIQIQTIREFVSDKYCLVDEGILQGFSFVFHNTMPLSFEEQLSKLFDNIQLPNGVVFFDGSIDMIIQRYQLRKKKLLQDKELSVEKAIESKTLDLEMKRKCYHLIKSKGVPSLYLSGEQTPEEKAERIKSFTEELHSSTIPFIRPLRLNAAAKAIIFVPLIQELSTIILDDSYLNYIL
jgi:hypothetical protein